MAQRKFNLEEMCPEALKKNLRFLGPGKLAAFEAMRAEIAERVAEEVRKLVKHRAAALEQSGRCHDAACGACGDAGWDHIFESMGADQLLNVFPKTPTKELNPNQLRPG